jgi:deferrochelatase/peroxidase EfeB
VTATPSRRGFIGAALGTAGVLAAGGGGYGVARATAAPPPSEHAGPVSFYGAHQAGIVTPAQDRLAFAAFDVTSVDIAALRALLGSWAAAAAQMASGQPVGPVETVPQAPPVDTGEALGLAPAQLTITVGFGPTLFDDRFGLANRRPAALADLPAFPGDGLDPRRTGGDLGVQACSNDPQVAFHVIRNFARIARGTAVMRWSQLGFGRTSTTSTLQATPRNLMGFKDGTNNIKAEHGAELNAFVWVGEETDQSWMRGGTYLVARRIRMLIESWDADDLADQERVIGRIKESGAPLGRRDEFDAVDLAGKTIRADAHIRLAAPASNGGAKMLRRGFSFTDGIDPITGQLDAGLFFLAFQKDPREQFVAIQARLAADDALNEYIKHTGSALFAVPPGLNAPGDWFGRALFD